MLFGQMLWAPSFGTLTSRTHDKNQFPFKLIAFIHREKPKRIMNDEQFSTINRNKIINASSLLQELWPLPAEREVIRHRHLQSPLTNKKIVDHPQSP